MNIVFFSNYFNHHQKPFSDAMQNIAEGAYTFVETSEMSEERKAIGYGGEQKPSYVVHYDHIDRKQKKTLEDADVIIFGRCPEKVLHRAKRKGKLIFRYSERPLKNGPEPLKYLPRFFKWHLRNLSRRPIYLLCASAFTASDYARLGLFKDRAFKWGYFPETRRYADIDRVMEEKAKQQILWCGRFLELKHPDDVIRAAKRLKDDGYAFELNFIGTGELQEQMGQLIAELGLAQEVHLLGPVSPAQVREQMDSAGIYVFSSDKQEGWGAVLNESMNSGCAVVASDAIGSVPFLVKDGENGMIYPSGNVDMLYEKLKYLLDHPAEQDRLGKAAYETIIREWNAETAAERLRMLSGKILSGEKKLDLFADGPCSPVQF